MRNIEILVILETLEDLRLLDENNNTKDKRQRGFWMKIIMQKTNYVSTRSADALQAYPRLKKASMNKSFILDQRLFLPTLSLQRKSCVSSFTLRTKTRKECFLDFSGVFWWQPNCSNLFPESSLLRKNQCICSIRLKCHKIFPSLRKNFSLELEKFCIQRLAGTDLFSLFRDGK